LRIDVVDRPVDGAPFHRQPHVALGIVEVAEEPRAADAGGDAGGHLATIHARVAGVALVGRAFLFVVEAGAVGAGVDAQPAADAGFLVDDHDAVLAAVGGAGRTGFQAGRVAAVVALGGDELLAQIGKDALHTGRVHPVARFAFGHIPLHAAGNQTGAAIDATRGIDDESIPFYVSHTHVLSPARPRECSQRVRRRCGRAVFMPSLPLQTSATAPARR
jgi:hypothetical protein